MSDPNIPELPATEVDEATVVVTQEPVAPGSTPVAPAASPVVTGNATTPVPSPKLFARSPGAPATSAFGRVGTDGIVYVRTTEGEREVGSYPGASSHDALAYFGRKYDELAASVTLLHQRVTQTDMPAKEAAEAVTRLREQVSDARVVGDLAALDLHLDELDAAVVARREQETQARAAAKAAAAQRRAALVAEAEGIAGTPEQRIQWKSAGTRMRELLDEWKASQRSGPRLDKETESSLWQRFSAARNSFDKARRLHFAALDSAHSEAKSAKYRLVEEAERLATSRDWAATAGTFKRLMDEWRRAGRAGRADDEALWERFKAAQDSFFAAKDAVVAAEEESFRGNLAVKEGLLAEAEALLPVTDLEAAKAALRVIQDKWERAGKVPRADMERTERAMRKVEQSVRDAEEHRWASSNPEALARAQSLVDQLERAVVGLAKDLEKANASGNTTKIADATTALQARTAWLAQARAGLEEFRPRG
jgi:hypothetical protein